MIWKRKKLLVFFSLLASFFLAGFFTLSTAHAVDFQTPVKYIETTTKPLIRPYVKSNGSINGWLGWWDIFATQYDSTGSANAMGIGGLGVRSNAQWGFSASNNDVFVLSLSVSNFTRSGFNLDSLLQNTGNCSEYHILDVRVDDLGDQSAVITLTFKPTQTSWTSTTDFYIMRNPSVGCSTDNWWLYLWSDTRISANYISHYVIVDPTANNSSVVNAINSQTDREIQAINNINDQQTQAGQQAQGDGNVAGSSSQQQAQQGGQTLLQGFSSFVGALTSANATNCVINANIGEFKMGNVDLCQISPPPAFQAISSIMVIGFVVPLSIATTRKFLSLFRSFQNG